MMVAAAILVACQPASPHLSSDHAVRVTRVAAAQYEGAAGDGEEAACLGWRLDPSQVERFFELSERFEENPYEAFYQVPCSVSGELQAEGRSWRFRINGGATATWSSGDEVRYWGCSEKECGALVLLATDLMEPDRP